MFFTPVNLSYCAAIIMRYTNKKNSKIEIVTIKYSVLQVVCTKYNNDNYSFWVDSYQQNSLSFIFYHSVFPSVASVRCIAVHNLILGVPYRKAEHVWLAENDSYRSEDSPRWTEFLGWQGLLLVIFPLSKQKLLSKQIGKLIRELLFN